MNITTARSFFEEVSRRGTSPRLRNISGSCRFELGADGDWVVDIDEGKLAARPAVANEPAPKAIFRGTGADLVRAVNAEGNENMLTLFMRGAFEVDGDLQFAQRLQALIPLPEKSS